ncbi:MAG: formyltransferase family protein, partial [Thermomicrobiales bacterium]
MRTSGTVGRSCCGLGGGRLALRFGWDRKPCDRSGDALLPAWRLARLVPAGAPGLDGRERLVLGACMKYLSLVYGDELLFSSIVTGVVERFRTYWKPTFRLWQFGSSVDTTQHAETRPWRLVVLISGAGRTLGSLIDAIERGDMNAEIVCVICSRSDVMGVAVAHNAGLPCRVVMPRNFESREEYSTAMYATISRFNPDLVLLAGYLRQLDMPDAWSRRVLNIHPSLLPETLAYAAGKGMYGIHVHRAVLEHGDTVSGATVHVVEAAYDSGP